VVEKLERMKLDKAAEPGGRRFPGNFNHALTKS
jgi:hypothetical protein